MKKAFVLSIALWIIASIAVSQSLPFKYQALIRDADGEVLTSQNVGLRISILQDTNAVMVYREEFNKTSDEFGIVDLEIGTGTVLSGNYLTIDWSKPDNQLQVEIDLSGGTTYTLLGNTPILSAPVANYALKAGGATFPPGLIMPFGGEAENIPEGWLLCDGSEISRTEYAGLFAAIGIAWGAGDLTSTFNLPDLRGQFLRGVDGSAGVDPDKNSRTAKYGGGNTGNATGSYQDDAFQGHWHKNKYSTDYNGYGSPGNGWKSNWANAYQDATTTSPSFIVDPAPDNIHGTPRTSNESRPKNVYVHYIIKY